MRTIKAAAAAILVLLTATVFAAAQPAGSCCNSPGLTPGGQEPVFQDLPKSGKRCWIGEVNYFTWEFDKTPKMGMSVLIVKLYDKDGTAGLRPHCLRPHRHALDAGRPRFRRGRLQDEQGRGLPDAGQRRHARRLGSSS